MLVDMDDASSTVRFAHDSPMKHQHNIMQLLPDCRRNNTSQTGCPAQMDLNLIKLSSPTPNQCIGISYGYEIIGFFQGCRSPGTSQPDKQRNQVRLSCLCQLESNAIVDANAFPREHVVVALTIEDFLKRRFM